MSIPPKFLYKFNIIPIKSTAGFYEEIHKLVLKFAWKCKVPKTAKPAGAKKKTGRTTALTSRLTPKLRWSRQLTWADIPANTGVQPSRDPKGLGGGPEATWHEESLQDAAGTPRYLYGIRALGPSQEMHPRQGLTHFNRRTVTGLNVRKVRACVSAWRSSKETDATRPPSGTVALGLQRQGPAERRDRVCVPCPCAGDARPLPCGRGSSPRPREPLHWSLSQGPPCGTSAEEKGLSGTAGTEGCAGGESSAPKTAAVGPPVATAGQHHVPQWQENNILTLQVHLHEPTNPLFCPGLLFFLFFFFLFFGNLSCKPHHAVNYSEISEMKM